jgi:hypothetical protein
LIRWGEEPQGKAGALQVQTYCGATLIVDFAAWVAGRADVTYDTRTATCAACAARADALLQAQGELERWATWGSA